MIWWKRYHSFNGYKPAFLYILTREQKAGVDLKLKINQKHIIAVTIGIFCLVMAAFSLWQTSQKQPVEQPNQSAMIDVSAVDDYKNIASSEQRTDYNIVVRYDAESQKIFGQMTVTIPNRQEETWSNLYFHLYPNVFREWEFNKASKPTSPGYLDVADVTVNGISIEPDIHKTLMQIKLPQPLPSQKVAEVDMAFTLQLPDGAMRLNHVDQTAFLAQWYPMLAAFDDDGWHTEPYSPTGDPFYTEMADFTVTFDVPPGYTVISSAEDEADYERKVTLSQQNIRDFAAVITKDYEKKTGNVGSTKVNLWYQDSMSDVVDELHAAAIKGMNFYNRHFGPYDYPEVDVVLGESGYGIAGMEYPGLVTSVDRITTREGEVPAVNVVVHELAHQWWYGMVGSNQAKEPWLDEGLTTYSESLLMDMMGKLEPEVYKQVEKSSNKVHDKKGLTVVDPLYDYPDQLYGLMVYARPAAMMWALSEEIGQDQVLDILGTYFERYRNDIATTEDFIRVANEVSAQNLDAFFDKWLYFQDESPVIQK